MKQPFLSLFIHHALVLTIIFGTIYAIVQQNYRMSANDPQIQIAEDAVNDIIKQGISFRTLVGTTTKDIGETIAPFMVIYDDEERALAWSGTIDGKPPVLPDGVLDYTREYGENRITWQPYSKVYGDIRIAAIIEHYEKGNEEGFVLVGRSLREIEEREYQLMLFVSAGWILSLSIDVFSIWIRRKTM
ncbi:MAG: hypothetical protein AAB917_02495 [Patescibacteria group bacterium]